MTLKKRSCSVLVASAALLFSSSDITLAMDDMIGGTPTRVKCVGGNACKGQSACGSFAAESGQGSNACKGQGWTYVDGGSREEAYKKCKDSGGHVSF
jgi:hypothetical protein